MFPKNIEHQAELFKCIGDATCLRLLYLLLGGDKFCVSDLQSPLGVSMPAVSHQLKKLRSMGILERERNGQTICYFLAKGHKSKKLKKVLMEVLWKS